MECDSHSLKIKELDKDYLEKLIENNLKNEDNYFELRIGKYKFLDKEEYIPLNEFSKKFNIVFLNKKWYKYRFIPDINKIFFKQNYYKAKNSNLDKEKSYYEVDIILSNDNAFRIIHKKNEKKIYNYWIREESTNNDLILNKKSIRLSSKKFKTNIISKDDFIDMLKKFNIVLIRFKKINSFELNKWNLNFKKIIVSKNENFITKDIINSRLKDLFKEYKINSKINYQIELKYNEGKIIKKDDTLYLKNNIKDYINLFLDFFYFTKEKINFELRLLISKKKSLKVFHAI